MVLSCPILDNWVPHMCQPVVGRLEKICPVLPANGSSAIKVILLHHSFQFSSVQLLRHVWLFATSWTAARQASLSIMSLLKLMSIESVMPSSHLIFCRPLLLLPSSIRKVNHLFTVVFRPLPTMPTMWGPGFNPWVGKIPWRRKWQPTPVFLPGEFHGWWNLVGYSPWGRKELDTTERLHFHSHFRPLQSFIYENVTRENKNRVLPEGLWLLEL